MYSSQFTDKSASMRASRSLYMKVVAGGTLAMTIVMFCVFSIYWGALWKIPAHNLQGWVVVGITLSLAILPVQLSIVAGL